MYPTFCWFCDAGSQIINVFMSYMTNTLLSIGNVHKSQNLANFGLTCIPEKGRGFVTVRAVTANLVSKDARLQSE